MVNDENFSSMGDMDRNHCLEIYKQYVNIISEMSNRRVNVNRYYVLALSVIVLALSAILRGSDVISNLFVGSNNTSNNGLDIGIDTIGQIVFITCIIASILSMSWLLNVIGYLRTNANRYKIVNNIESAFQQKLDIIFKNSDKFDSGYPKNYYRSAFHETIAPATFAIGFSCLSTIGTKLFTDSRLVLWIPVSIITCLCIYIITIYIKGGE